MRQPEIKEGDRLVFHINGGARKGGTTLTAASGDLTEAGEEAREHFFLGGGTWDYRFTNGPDDDGHRYHHFDWRGRA